jgi:hypothetical protein
LSTLDPDILEDTNFDVADVAPAEPKRRGRKAYPRDADGNIIRPDGSTSRPAGRTKTKSSLESQISGFVTLANMLVNAYKPGMALDQAETTLLVRAIDAQAQTSPKFRKFIENFLKGAGSANLLGVVILIAGRRVARADLIPLPADAPVKSTDFDNMLGALIFSMAQGKPAEGLGVS